jgi:heme A synthase
VNPVAPADSARPADTISRLALAVLALLLLIPAAAAFLRLSQAGLGCSDWPACYGRLEANAAALQQGASESAVRIAHRVAALTATALVLALGWLVMARRPRRPGEVAVIAAMLLLLVFLAVIGRWSSLSRIPAVPLGNILGGSALLALAWLLWLLQHPVSFAPARPTMTAMAWAALVAFFLQSALGALVSANYAALACSGLFSCTGASAVHLRPAIALFASPAEQGAGALATLQWAHHLGAAAVLALSALLGAGMAGTPGSRGVAAALLVSSIAQTALGMAAIRLGHPLAVVMAHNVVANLLLLALVSAAHHLSREPGRPGTAIPA